MSPERTADEDFQPLEDAGGGFSSRWKRSPVALALAAALLSIVPYLFAIHFAFVYDDHGSIVENPFLRQPDAWLKTLTLRTFFEPHILDGQRPVVILSYLADKALWGFSPAGFHASNILLHAASVALFFGLLSSCSVSPLLRFAASLLFGLHPALTEAVQVPAFREDLLAAFFTLAFLVLALRRRFVPALLAEALALCSKETAIVAPVLLGWLWLCFPGSTASAPVRRRLFLLAAACGLVCLYLAITFTHRPLQSAGQVWNGLALRWPDNVSTAPWIFLREVATLLVPRGLCADYVVQPVSFTDPAFYGGLALLLVAGGAAVGLRRRHPVQAFGLGWLLINFFPVSNLVPLFNPMADRYLYLPAAGFAALLASLLCSPRLRRWPGLPAVLLATLCALYFGLTLRRLGDWRNDGTLWRATAATEPRSARAQTWLGLLAAEKGNLDEMRRRYETADRLNPQAVHPLVNLGVLDGQAGRLVEAEGKFRMAVERRPDFPDGWWNLAIALKMQGRDAEAQQVARRAAQINPLDPRAAAFGLQPPPAERR